jgi:hypothetical protein
LQRSLYFSYDRSGNILDDAKGKVPVSLSGWKNGIKKGKLSEVLCSKKLGTWPIKNYAAAFARTLAPDLRLLPIPEPMFAKFLTGEKAKNDSWTMRFWEINDKEDWSRAITAGQEKPEIWAPMTTAMAAAQRRTAWAGVEFTHPSLEARVIIHRWPTAAIAPFGEGGASYLKVKERFVNLLTGLI